MNYKDEKSKEQAEKAFGFLKILFQKIFFILSAIVLIIAIILSVNFFRYVVLGKTKMGEFKNNSFGLPINKLLKINQQINKKIQNQYKVLDRWLKKLGERLSS